MSVVVYVVDTHTGFGTPYVTRYLAREVRVDSFTLAGEGSFNTPGVSREQVIRRASGRRFFTNHAAMMAHCRQWMERQRSMHIDAVARLDGALSLPGLGLQVVTYGSSARPPDPPEPPDPPDEAA